MWKMFKFLSPKSDPVKKGLKSLSPLLKHVEKNFQKDQVARDAFIDQCIQALLKFKTGQTPNG